MKSTRIVPPRLRSRTCRPSSAAASRSVSSGARPPPSTSIATQAAVVSIRSRPPPCSGTSGTRAPSSPSSPPALAKAGRPGGGRSGSIPGGKAGACSANRRSSVHKAWSATSIRSGAHSRSPRSSRSSGRSGAGSRPGRRIPAAASCSAFQRAASSSPPAPHPPSPPGPPPPGGRPLQRLPARGQQLALGPQRLVRRVDRVPAHGEAALGEERPRALAGGTRPGPARAGRRLELRVQRRVDQRQAEQAHVGREPRALVVGGLAQALDEDALALAQQRPDRLPLGHAGRGARVLGGDEALLRQAAVEEGGVQLRLDPADAGEEQLVRHAPARRVLVPQLEQPLAVQDGGPQAEAGIVEDDADGHDSLQPSPRSIANASTTGRPTTLA